MTSSKNGTRRLILIFATVIILPGIGWVFNEVVWGGIQENRATGIVNASEIARVEKEADESRDTIEANVVSQLHDLRVQLNRFEFKQAQESIDRKMMDSLIIHKLNKLLGD